MALVGDFTPTETTDPDAEPDTFEFCGETFDIPATVGTFAALQFSWRLKSAQGQAERGEQAKRRAVSSEGKARAETEIIEADLTAMSAIYDLLRSVLGDNQLDRFGRIADANGVNQAGLMSVVDQIQEVIAGRPTKRSADSSDGPSTTGDTSTAGGSGPTAMTPRQQQAAAIEAASTPVG